MSIIDAKDLLDHQVVSVVIPGISSDYPNHSPLSRIDVSQGGQILTVHIYRGKHFHDVEGASFTPLGYLTLSEYRRLSSLINNHDEPDSATPRRLPMEWEKIDFMVLFMRKLSCHLAEYSQLTHSVPADMYDAANLAIEVTFGSEWNLSNLTDHPSQNEVLPNA